MIALDLAYPAVAREPADPLSVLRTFIADGSYAPGDRLPPDRELVATLGLTRNALRKALGALERDGAIWRHVGKGTFIASRSVTAATLADLADQVSPVHLMRTRMALEPAIAREAAMHASADALSRIRLEREAAEAAETWGEYEARDDSFHRALAEAAGNMLLLSLFDHLNEVRRAVAWNTVVRGMERPPRDHASFAEHGEIAAAIESRDAAAAHGAMMSHLRSVSARLFGEA